MLTAYETAALSVQHFTYAAILACLYAAVTLAYLVAMWRLAGRVGRGVNLLVHTLFLLWQSNIAFVAVVSLSVAVTQAELAGEIMLGWRRAPFLVPAAALLYSSMLLLTVVFAWLCARDSQRV